MSIYTFSKVYDTRNAASITYSFKNVMRSGKNRRMSQNDILRNGEIVRKLVYNSIEPLNIIQL